MKRHKDLLAIGVLYNMFITHMTDKIVFPKVTWFPLDLQGTLGRSMEYLCKDFDVMTLRPLHRLDFDNDMGNLNQVGSLILN